MSSVDAPPPPNPVLTAYQDFVSSTPLVTRYVISFVFLSYFSSWFVDPNMALANIPLFTIQKFELYRLITAPLLCNSLLNLIFAYLSFVENGKRLEYAMGSGAFGCLLGLLALLANLCHVMFCYTVYLLTKQDTILMYPAASIWIVVLALIAAECSKAPRDSKRKLFIIEVPTLYYPLAILALFTLFSGGLQFPFVFAVGVGYAYGYNKLTTLQVSNVRITRWEGNNGCLSNFTKRPGWVYGHAAQGTGAWSNAAGSGGGNSNAQSGGGWTPSAFRSGQPATSSSAAGGGAGAGGAATGAAFPEPGKVSKPEFPKGRGQALGSGGTTSSRSTNPEEARRARLAALERRGGDSNV